MRVAAAVLGLSLLGLTMPKCPPPTPTPPPAPGPVCSPTLLSCCWTLVGGEWVKAPCGDPTPEPTPSPLPTPTPSPLACTMGTGTGEGAQCRMAGPLFLPQVEAAIHAVVLAHPEVFDRNDTVGEDGYKVLDATRYHALVVAELRARGFCTSIQPPDGIEEIAVKQGDDNSFGEGYDIHSGSEHIIHSYRGTCWPAWFKGDEPLPGSSTPPSAPPSAPPSVPPSAPPSVPPSTPPSPPCLAELPADPVPVNPEYPSGRCAPGLTRHPYTLANGTPYALCLAPSSCTYPAQRCRPGTSIPDDLGCWSMETRAGIELRNGNSTLECYGNECYINDVGRGNFDAYGQKFRWDTKPTRATRTGTIWDGNCPVAMCSSTPPTPPPPTPGPSTPPTPQPGATPGPPCPELLCMLPKVHQHQTPEHATWPHDWGLVGGYTNLDSTTGFSPRCGALNSCDNEHPQACGGRKCQDPRGPTWAKVSGPEVDWYVTTPGDEGRGYGVRIGPHQHPGVSVWRVCAPQDWRDYEGYAVTVAAGTCRDVSFEVR